MLLRCCNNIAILFINTETGGGTEKRIFSPSFFSHAAMAVAVTQFQNSCMYLEQLSSRPPRYLSTIFHHPQVSASARDTRKLSRFALGEMANWTVTIGLKRLNWSCINLKTIVSLASHLISFPAIVFEYIFCFIRISLAFVALRAFFLFHLTFLFEWKRINWFFYELGLLIPAFGTLCHFELLITSPDGPGLFWWTRA